MVVAVRRTRNRNVDLARDVRRIADLDDPFVQQLHERCERQDFTGIRSGVGTRDDVADRVAAGTLRRQPDVAQSRPDGWHVFDVYVMDLESAARGDVNAAVPEVVSEIGDPPNLCGRSFSAR